MKKKKGKFVKSWEAKCPEIFELDRKLYREAFKNDKCHFLFKVVYPHSHSREAGRAMENLFWLL